MITRSSFLGLAGAALLTSGLATGIAQAQTAKVYELRTYTANPGKHAELQCFFKEATEPAFTRRDMKAVACWRPLDAPDRDTTLFYIIEHASKPAGVASWDKFRADPDWVKARTASEANGPIVTKAVGVYADPLAFSALK